MTKQGTSHLQGQQSRVARSAAAKTAALDDSSHGHAGNSTTGNIAGLHVSHMPACMGLEVASAYEQMLNIHLAGFNAQYTSRNRELDHPANLLLTAELLVLCVNPHQGPPHQVCHDSCMQPVSDNHLAQGYDVNGTLEA